MNRKLCLLAATLLALAACGTTGTAPPMKADTTSMTSVGTAHGP